MKLYTKLLASTVLISMAGTPVSAQNLGMFNEFVGGVSMRRVRAQNLYSSAQLKKSIAQRVVQVTVPTQVTASTLRAKSLNSVFQKHLALPGNAVAVTLPKIPDVRLITLRIEQDTYVEQDNVFLAKGSIVVQLPNGDFRFFTKDAPPAQGFLEQVAQARERVNVPAQESVPAPLSQEQKVQAANEGFDELARKRAFEQQVANGEITIVQKKEPALESQPPTPEQLESQFQAYVKQLDQAREKKAYDDYWLGEFGGQKEYYSWKTLEEDLKRFYAGQIVPRMRAKLSNEEGVLYVFPVQGITCNPGGVRVNIDADRYFLFVAPSGGSFMPRDVVADYTNYFELIP